MYTDKQKEFRKENLILWKEKLLNVFNGAIPSHYEWNNMVEIVDVINSIGIESLNHMLYPDSGGLDIVGWNISGFNRNLIEISVGGTAPNICSPLKLVFDCIDNEAEWAYFRLELNELQSSGLYTDKKIIVEELYEYNGIFELYSEYPSNNCFRHILRVLKGTLLIIPKSCYYNNIPETYLGTHNRYNHTGFRRVMEKLKLSKGYIDFLKDME